MPITVGSQTDVPATGDPIVSPWYQDTATKIVHRFATVAARNAWTTRPAGAMAFTDDDNAVSMWNGTAWVTISDKVARTGDTMSNTLQVGGDPNARVIGTNVNPGQVQTLANAASSNFWGIRTNSAAGEAFLQMYRYATPAMTTTLIGSITQVSTSGTAYNTTSDPRMKSAGESRGIDDAAERAAQLGAAAWRGQYFDADSGEPAGDTFDFLSSHDVEDVAGYAVTGERDAVDDDGHPIYQQVNYPALVPLLFAALSNALERIAVLEAAA